MLDIRLLKLSFGLKSKSGHSKNEGTEEAFLIQAVYDLVFMTLTGSSSLQVWVRTDISSVLSDLIGW